MPLFSPKKICMFSHSLCNMVLFMGVLLVNKNVHDLNNGFANIFDDCRNKWN